MSFFKSSSSSNSDLQQAMPLIAQGMADRNTPPTPTLAAAPPIAPTAPAATPAAAPPPPIQPPSAPAAPAQAPSYAARAAGRSGPRGGIASTILTSGAGLTTRAATGQKTLLGQ